MWFRGGPCVCVRAWCVVCGVGDVYCFLALASQHHLRLVIVPASCQLATIFQIIVSGSFHGASFQTCLWNFFSQCGFNGTPWFTGSSLAMSRSFGGLLDLLEAYCGHCRGLPGHFVELGGCRVPVTGRKGVTGAACHPVSCWYFWMHKQSFIHATKADATSYKYNPRF